MSLNILIIGGVALGPKAACRCKRLAPDAHVVIVDENPLVSYGGCGIPFYLSGEINNIDELRSTPYHTLRDAEFFRTLKGVHVRTETRALSIDRRTKTVLASAGGAEERLPYDKLVLAVGASPRIPPVEGRDLEGVHAVTKLEAARAIRKDCEDGVVNRAVIVGGGFIGLESAVALGDMWGVECTVVEMTDQLLPGALSANLAAMARRDLASHKVDVLTGEKVTRLEGENGRVARVVTDKRTLDAQLVIFAAGFQPNSRLAREAGLDVTPQGGILVDDHMRTSDPDIYAGGDCAVTLNLITGKLGYMPLGSLANRQGRVIGANLAGGDARFPGHVGTWAVKLFDLSFCGVGLTRERARAEGIDAAAVSVEQLDRAHFYPDNHMMHLELVVERATRRVLGAQGACEAGDALKARIDAVAAALQCSRPTVDDISNLEAAYSPPFASAMDVLNTVANAVDNELAGRVVSVSALEFMEIWRKRADNNVFFIDARPAAAGKAMQEKLPDWRSMPLEEIPNRLDEIPRDRPVAIICNTGLRSYDAALMLKNAGIDNVVNSAGGMQAVLKMGLSPED